MKKKENIIMTIGLLLLIVAVLGVSYAAFSYTRIGEKINTITTGVLSMSYTESDNVISMDKVLPTTDATGKVRLRDGEYFDFTVESTIEGTEIINYEIAAEALSSNTFDGANVRLYLTKINGTTEEEVMAPKNYAAKTTANKKTGRPSGMMKLLTGTMSSSETVKYRLRMYVDEMYNPQDDNGNEVFQVRINVYGKTAVEPTGTLIKAKESNDFHDVEYSSKTTKVVTKDNNEIPSTAIKSWDISERGDGKAVAYYEDDGTGDGTYILTLGGEEGLVANSDMSYYFGGGDFVNSEYVYLFEKVSSIDLTYLDTSQVTSMKSMFYYFGGDANLQHVDLSMLDTSKVTTMEAMFANCSSLTSLNVSEFDTSSLTRMDSMFQNCTSLTTLDISNLDTSKVTDMSWVFASCSGLTKINVNNLDTSNVLNMYAMFSSCSSLVELDLRSFDTSKTTNMADMFSGSIKLSSVKVSSKWVINAETNVNQMFNGCLTDHVTYV